MILSLLRPGKIISHCCVTWSHRASERKTRHLAGPGESRQIFLLRVVASPNSQSALCSISLDVLYQTPICQYPFRGKKFVVVRSRRKHIVTPNRYLQFLLRLCLLGFFHPVLCHRTTSKSSLRLLQCSATGDHLNQSLVEQHHRLALLSEQP